MSCLNCLYKYIFIFFELQLFRKKTISIFQKPPINPNIYNFQNIYMKCIVNRLLKYTYLYFIYF